MQFNLRFWVLFFCRNCSSTKVPRKKVLNEVKQSLAGNFCQIRIWLPRRLIGMGFSTFEFPVPETHIPQRQENHCLMVSMPEKNTLVLPD